MIRRLFPAAAVALALVAAPPAHAKKNKIRHTNVVAPAWSGEVADVGVGTITHLRAHGDTIYVAGSSGVAAVGPDGAVKWKTALPPLAVRNLDVEDGLLAWTGFSVAGVDPSEGFQRFVMGSIGDAITVEGASVGALDPATGEVKWQVASDEQSTLSPPAISSTSIGVTRARSFVALDRASGAELGRYDLKGIGVNSQFFSGVFDQAPRVEPLATEDAFYTGFFSHLIKLDLDGNFVDKSWGNGLTPYVTITCGPVEFAGQIVIGSTGDTQVDGAFFGVKPKNLKGTFREWIPDQNSGCSSMFVDGDTVIAATNFYVVELDRKGKIKWQSVNKKGGLYPSANRGLRFVNGSWPVRKSHDDLVVSDGKRVYVAAKNTDDVITVLDRKTGAYVETIDVDGTIVGFALAGGKLAVASGTRLGFL